MKDKICIVTGATSGIGEITARELAKKGAHVILMARSKEKAEKTKQDILSVCGHDKIDIVLADFSSFKQIREAAQEINSKYARIDVLINNAGLVEGNSRSQTEDGFETTIAINHLAPFLLTALIFEKLKQSDDGRIINVSSEAHQTGKSNFDDFNLEKSYSAIRAYGNSKLYNILFTQELAKRAAIFPNISSFSLHPGVVATNFAHNITGGISMFFRIFRPFFISAEKGAETTIFLATDPNVKKDNGKYFKKKKTKNAAASANPENASKLWAISEKLTNIKFL